MSKKSLREFYKSAFSRLSEDEVAASSSEAVRLLLSQPFFKDVSSIMCYVSLHDELSTVELIDFLLNGGFRVSVPLITEDRGMLAVYISSVSQLCSGSFGIMEPVYSSRNVAEKSDIDLAVIPGVCFDKKCGRLGRGAGYYDRFLKDFSGIKVGFCHHSCISDSLVVESHDVPMDFVVTDRCVFSSENSLFSKYIQEQ